MKKISRFLFVLLLVFLTGVVFACQDRASLDESPPTSQQAVSMESADERLDPEGYYYELDELAAYIHQFGHLPANYISKQEAKEMGWTTEDREWVVGGDYFANYEGQLPEKPGRQYYEADIQAGYTHHRGPERLVFSNDGLVFYTADHYDSFDRLY